MNTSSIHTPQPNIQAMCVNLVVLVIVIVGYEISYSYIMLYLTIVHNHIYNLYNLQDGAPEIAFSWFISGLTVAYCRYNELP